MTAQNSPAVPRGPTRGAVLLFIAAVVTAVILVIGGTSYAVVSANRQISLQQEQIALERQQVAQEREQVTKACGFYRDLAGVPIAVTPPAKAPSLLGVTLILSALQAYDGPLCGHLAPSPSLRKWAAFYGLRLP